MPHEIASVVRCKLCPPATAKTIAGPTLVLGPGQNNRVGHFMQSLATHIAQAHPQQHEYLQQKALEFMGLQTVMQYATTDANIQHSRNWLRWQIHQATIDARIPDDKIETQSRDFARELVASIVDEVSAYFMAAQRPALFNSTHAVEATAAKVERLVRGVRDVLQEPTEPKPPKP